MASTLSTLLGTPGAPGFIYLHHPHTPTSACLTSFSTSDKSASSSQASPLHVELSAVELNTPRLLYSGIVHRLADASGTKDGWDGGEISTWDGFARGLRAIYAARVTSSAHSRVPGKKLVNGGTPKAGGNGKGKAAEQAANGHIGSGRGGEEPNWVVTITHAERLPRILGGQWAVITRLSELVGLPFTVILASQIPWDALRPHAADAPDPTHICLPALTRSETQAALLIACAHPLWPHFLNLFLATFFPLSPDLGELAYLAEPLWQLYTSNLPLHAESYLLARSHDHGIEPAPSPVPKLEITVKLLTDLKFALSLPLTLAIEHLLPRHISPREFVRHLKQNQHANPLSLGARRAVLPALPGVEAQVPLLGKFLLVSGYLAGQNPPKSDLRLFGRALGADGKKKKGGGTRRAGYGRLKVGKVPQRFLGPKPFPLDRLLAIFSSLYSEHAERPLDLQAGLGESDDESDSGSSSSSSSSSSSRVAPDSPSRRARDNVRLNGIARNETVVEKSRRRVEKKRKRDTKREERWEEEVEGTCMSVKLWSMIPDLEAQGLLKRISPPDRLDNVMLRCEIAYEVAKTLARELKMTLDEYLYEAQA